MAPQNEHAPDEQASEASSSHPGQGNHGHSVHGDLPEDNVSHELDELAKRELGYETAKEAEIALLGSMLACPEALPEMLGHDGVLVSSADFAMPAHRLIFDAMRKAYREHGQVLPLTVKDELERSDRLDDAGGLDYLLDLLDQSVSAGSVRVHAIMIRKAARARELKTITLSMARQATAGKPIIDLLDRAAELSREVSEKSRRVAEVVPLQEVESLPATRWLIDGLLPANSIGMLVAEPNLGKTTLAAAWAMSIAHEAAWCGRAVQGGGVLFITGEGRVGIGRRTRAWRAWSGAERQVHPFDVAHKLPALSSGHGLAELRGLIEDFRASRFGPRPVLVIVDTLAVHWAESEDKSEFVGPCMAELRAIADAGTSILLLHHTRKPGNAERGSGGGAWAGVRGSGAWVGAADCVLSLTGTPEAISLSVTKQREAERGAPTRLRLRGVDIGDGEQAAVVVLDDAREDDLDPAVDPMHEIMVQRVVDAMRALGGIAASKASVYGRMTGKTDAKKAAFAEALVRGLVVQRGSNDLRRFHLVEAADPSEKCVVRPPIPPEGQGSDPSRLSPGSGPGPQEGRGQAGSSKGSRVKHAGFDDGRPEHPGGPRRSSQFASEPARARAL